MKLLELFDMAKVQNNQQPTNGASAIFEGTKSYSQHALNDMVEDHLPENTRVWKIQWIMSEDGNDNYRPQFIFAKTKDEAAHKFTERMKHPSLGLVAIESIIEIPFDQLTEGEVIPFPTKQRRMSDQQKYDMAVELQRINRESEWRRDYDWKKVGDPTREEMQDVLVQIFEEEDDLKYWGTIAIYWFASDFHSGQNSNLYSVLSTSVYNPGPMISKIEDEDNMTQEMYFTLYDYFSKSRAEDEFDEGKKKKKKKKSLGGAWNKAEQYTKYDPPQTGNKGVSARAGFVGG